MINHNDQAQLDMIYDGPALADGSMNVRDLAPALMAVGSFFEAANRTTNGERASISVNVRATSAGSFHIAFEVVQSLQMSNLLGSDFSDLITTANALKALLVGGPGLLGIFTVIKRLRGRRPQAKKINEKLYSLTIDDETYEVPIELLRLYQDASVRQNLQEIIKPVSQRGIDRFAIGESGKVVEEISKDDLMSFETPEINIMILDEVRQHAFSIVSLSFKEDNRWRLTDGQNTFSVLMNDEAFVRKVDANQAGFFKGDVLICQLRTRQWRVKEGVRSEYEVVEVVDHQSSRQLPLFDGDEQDNVV